MKLTDVMKILEEVAPLRYAESWDNVGLLVGDPDAEISRVLGFLKYYSSWHFEREEECMERHRCAAAEVNKKAHCQFVMTFIALEEEFRASGGSPELALRMHRELTSWMVRHIRGVDLELREVAIPAPDPDAMSFA